MSSITVNLPDTVKTELADLAQRRGVALEELVRDAIESELDADRQIEYLKARARRADPEAFQRILDRVPSVPPAPEDRIE